MWSRFHFFSSVGSARDLYYTALYELVPPRSMRKGPVNRPRVTSPRFLTNYELNQNILLYFERERNGRFITMRTEIIRLSSPGVHLPTSFIGRHQSYEKLFSPASISWQGSPQSIATSHWANELQTYPSVQCILYTRPAANDFLEAYSGSR